VIINRQNGSYPAMEEFCTENHLPVLLHIPFERVIAEGLAQGKTLVEIHPEYKVTLWEMFLKIRDIEITDTLQNPRVKVLSV
jgi:MinD superfamily P-loop ATPase